MKNTSFAAMTLAFIIIGAGSIVLGVVPDPEILLGNLPGIIGIGLIAFGGGMIVMFYGYAYHVGAFSGGQPSSAPSDPVRKHLRRVSRMLQNTPRLERRKLVLHHLDEARAAIDAGDFDEADAALDVIEREIRGR